MSFRPLGRRNFNFSWSRQGNETTGFLDLGGRNFKVVLSKEPKGYLGNFFVDGSLVGSSSFGSLKEGKKSFGGFVKNSWDNNPPWASGGGPGGFIKDTWDNNPPRLGRIPSQVPSSGNVPVSVGFINPSGPGITKYPGNVPVSVGFTNPSGPGITKYPDNVPVSVGFTNPSGPGITKYTDGPAVLSVPPKV